MPASGRRAEAADLSPERPTRSRAGRPTAATSRSPPRAPATTTSPIRLFTVPAAGGFATQLPLPIVERRRTRQTPRTWRTCRIRSGRRRGNGIVAARRRRLDREPGGFADRDGSRARTPTTSTRCGSAARVYFLSDRNGPVSLFAYDVADEAGDRGWSRTTASISSPRRPDPAPSSSSSSARSSCSTSTTHQLRTRRREARGRFARTADAVREGRPQAHSQLRQSRPTGVRAVMEAWGEIFTVPAEKGDVRNLTHSPAWPSAIPRGRLTESRSPTSPTRPASTSLEIRDQTGTRRGEEDRARSRRSTTRRSGRRTRRGSRSATSG